MRTRSINRWGGTGLTSILLAAALTAIAMPTDHCAAQVEGVSYTLTPTYNWIFWDDALGLEDTELWGGRLSYNLGRYVSLEGYYLGRNKVDTDLQDVFDVDGPGGSPLDQELDIIQYGGDLVLNLGTRGFTPFLKGGGGIIRFSPDEGDVTRAIALKAGGGFRFGLDRFQVKVFAEDLAFRTDRYNLAAPGDAPYPEDPDRDEVRHNLSVGVGVDFFLGGSTGGRVVSDTDAAVAQRFERGLRGLSIPVEPFVGRLEFNDRLNLDEQELVGIRTGLDLGPYLGLRGYYWRGVNEDFDKTEPIQSYGGEAQFNLSRGEGAVPFLVGGVGHLEFENDFEDPDGNSREDRTMLTFGGGIAFRLGDRIRLHAAARDYLFSDDDLEDVTDPDELFSNWMLEAGLTFNLFGYSADGRRPFFASPEARAEVPPAAPVAPGAPPEAPEAPESPEFTWVEADSAEPGVKIFTGEDGRKEIIVEKKIRKPGPEGPPPIRQDFQGRSVIPIPVPTEGEIYIRYGRPGGVHIESRNVSKTPPPPDTSAAPAPTETGAAPAPMDPETVRMMIREELAAARQKPEAPAPSDDTMELWERRLAERIDKRFEEQMERERRLWDERFSRVAGQGGGAPGTVVVTGGGDSPGDQGTVVTVQEEPYSWKLRGYRAYTGFNADDPGQWVIGGRLNLGPVTRGSRFLFMPELSLGFGSDVTSYLFGANLNWVFRDLAEKGDWSPYVMAGGGLFGFSGSDDEFDGTEGVINLAYGFTAHLGRYVFFAEHQGVDLYEFHRILVGIQLRD